MNLFSQYPHRQYYPTVFFLLITLFFSPALTGQDNNFKLKEGSISGSDKPTGITIIGEDETGSYALWSVDKSLSYQFYIQHLDRDMQPDKRAKIRTYKDGHGKHYFVFASMLGDNIYLFSAVSDPSGMRIRLFAQKVNKETLKGDGEETEVASTSVTDMSLLMDCIDPRGLFFAHAVSPDRSKIAILSYPTAYDETSTPVDYEVKIYDPDMKLIVKNKETVENKKLGLFLTGNDGTVYMNWQPFGVFSATEGQSLMFDYLTPDNEMLSAILDLDGNLADDVLYYQQKNGLIVCAGTCTEGLLGKVGVFYAIYDPEKRTFISKSSIAFNYSGKIVPASNDKVNFRESAPSVVGICVNDQEEVSVCIEAFGAAQSFYKINDRTYSQFTHYSDDILVVRFNKDGKIGASCIIPHRTMASDDDEKFQGAFLACSSGRTFLIYNEKKSNVNLRVGNSVDLYDLRKGDQVILATLDENGKLTEEMLPVPTNTRILPANCSENRMTHSYMLFLGRDGMYQIDKIFFN